MSYYVKFFGSESVRESPLLPVKKEVERALCHYACCFSVNKKPVQINEGDVIYMGRMLKPNDYAIFGKADARDFISKKDIATPNEIEERSWKKDWPIYLRVLNPIFIDSTLMNCPSLYSLIHELKHNSFPTTKERYEGGEWNINPRRSLSNQAYVKLTAQANDWLDTRFQEALKNHGKIKNEFINSLPYSERSY